MYYVVVVTYSIWGQN